MAVNPIITLAGDIADRLARGLDQDADSAHCLVSTLGPLAPEDLAARLADPGDSEIAPLRELFFFPGPDLARDLEPALVEANLDAAGETALSRTLADTLPPVRIVLPSGEAFVLKMTPAEIEIWVRRLRPSRTAPAAVRQALSTRFPHDRALELAVACRQTGPDWTTPGREPFFLALLARLPSADTTPPADETVRFALRFLAALPAADLPLAALPRHREGLANQLRRAKAQEETLARSNFETRIMTGIRLPYLHAPDIARELALADAALLALTGRTGASREPIRRDLGTVTDAAGLLAALGGLEEN